MTEIARSEDSKDSLSPHPHRTDATEALKYFSWVNRNPTARDANAGSCYRASRLRSPG
jgi:hypothetical protein